MAFVNLPPNFQDIFAVINDRISKLETGPNQAMYTAVAANGTAQEAYAQALNASAQATQATYEAGIAVQSANGKSVTHYSSSAPGTTAGNNGDIWFQVNSSTGVVEYQYIYNGGVWNNSPIANTVISNLDAGKITAGTITGIAYNNGSGTFTVSSLGALVATSATVQGVIRGNSGYFTGTVTASAGQIGGFNIGTTYLSSVDASSGYRINSSTGAANFSTVTTSSSITTNGGLTLATGSGNLSMGTNNINNAGTIGCSVINASAASTFSGITSGTNINSFTSQVNYSGISTGSGSTMVLVTTGSRVAYTTSSERFKEQIVYLDSAGWLDKVTELRPITYVTAADYVVEGEPNPPQLGFLAEDLADLGNEIGLAVNNDPLNEPFSISYERLVAPLVLAVKELKARVVELESKIQ